MNDKATTINDQAGATGSLDKLAELEYIKSKVITDQVDKLWTAAWERKQEELRDLPRTDSGDDAVTSELSGYRERIDKAFLYTYERDPSLADSIAGSIETARSKLSSGQMADLKTTSDAVNDWEGEAKKSFSRYFLNPFGQAVSNQQAVCEELKVAIAAYGAILRAARLDAKAIAEKCTSYIESMNGTNGKPPDQQKSTFELIGIGLAVATAAKSGAGVSLGLGLLGIANDEAKKLFPSDETGSRTFTSPWVEGVLDELLAGLEDVKRTMDAQERAIASGLDTSLENITKLLHSSESLTRATILPNEPAEDEHGMKDDDRPNLTDGEKPDKGQFKPG